ncbi:hypothetical protein KY289_005699 [Solanum tuberosum]|nr:hypothetical protein KY289_005699 [Solanum tuberosum]
MRLRLFPLSLTGEATHWLNEMPNDSIRTWTELKEAFLERFFPESKELQMKDEISAHKQLPGEAMHDTWWRFNRKLKRCPNHSLTERHLDHAFYRSLNYVTKPIADAVCRGSFMWCQRITGHVEQRKREEETDQDMAHMRTQINLLTKHTVSKSEKGKCCGTAKQDGTTQGKDNMSQLVDSHTTSIKQIEQQLGQLSASLNQRKNGSLPSDTI